MQPIQGYFQGLSSEYYLAAGCATQSVTLLQDATVPKTPGQRSLFSRLRNLSPGEIVGT